MEKLSKLFLIVLFTFASAQMTASWQRIFRSPLVYPLYGWIGGRSAGHIYNFACENDKEKMSRKEWKKLENRPKRWGCLGLSFGTMGLYGRLRIGKKRVSDLFRETLSDLGVKVFQEFDQIKENQNEMLERLNAFDSKLDHGLANQEKMIDGLSDMSDFLETNWGGFWSLFKWPFKKKIEVLPVDASENEFDDQSFCKVEQEGDFKGLGDL